MQEDQAFESAKTAEFLGPEDPIGSDAGRFRADDMRRVAASLFHKLSGSVEAMIHDQKIAGATIVSDVARAGFHAADDLETSTPDAARLLRKASASVEHIAENLRRDDLGQIFGSLRDFGRAQPLTFVGGALVGGFLIARSIRSGRLTSAMQGASARAASLTPTAGAR